MSLPNPHSTSAATLVRLTVPAEPASLAVVRVVVAGIGSRADLSIDDLDDLTIATEEAALTLISHGADEVEVEAAVTPGQVAMTVTSDGDAAAWPPPELDSSISWRVLSGLSEDARFAGAGQRPALSFRKRGAAR